MNIGLKDREAVYLYGLSKIAKERPREATHLLSKIFDKGKLEARLAAFRTALFSASIGDGKLLGDFFVRLMAGATEEERKEMIEPFIEILLQHSSKPTDPIVKRKIAWLYAFYHGWKEERVS